MFPCFYHLFAATISSFQTQPTNHCSKQLWCFPHAFIAIWFLLVHWHFLFCSALENYLFAQGRPGPCSWGMPPFINLHHASLPFAWMLFPIFFMFFMCLCLWLQSCRCCGWINNRCWSSFCRSFLLVSNFSLANNVGTTYRLPWMLKKS